MWHQQWPGVNFEAIDTDTTHGVQCSHASVASLVFADVRDARAQELLQKRRCIQEERQLDDNREKDQPHAAKRWPSAGAQSRGYLFG